MSQDLQHLHSILQGASNTFKVIHQELQEIIVLKLQALAWKITYLEQTGFVASAMGVDAGNTSVGNRPYVAVVQGNNKLNIDGAGMEDEGMNVEDNSVNKDIGLNPKGDTNDSRDKANSSGKIKSSTHDGIKPIGVHSAAKVVDAGSYEDTNTGSKPACGVGNGTMLASMQSGPNLFDDRVMCQVKNKYENSLVGRISFAHALVEISSDTDLKEVIMAEDGTSYTREVISVEYKLHPQRDLTLDLGGFARSNYTCAYIEDGVNGYL
ncbi:hypothetical protein Tco_0437723 [Tanacetum coccineum]